MESWGHLLAHVQGSSPGKGLLQDELFCLQDKTHPQLCVSSRCLAGAPAGWGEAKDKLPPSVRFCPGMLEPFCLPVPTITRRGGLHGAACQRKDISSHKTGKRT